MSCFKLLDGLCRDLEKMMVKFWWGQKKDENRIHWVSWSKMCMPKKERFGFSRLKAV